MKALAPRPSPPLMWKVKMEPAPLGKYGLVQRVVADCRAMDWDALDGLDLGTTV